MRPELDQVLDHLIITCPDLDEMCDDIARRWGVNPKVGGRHERGGTVNALIGMRPGYLELIARAPGAQPEPGLPFGLDRDSPAALRTWAASVPYAERAIAGARSAGCDLGPFRVGQRRRQDGTSLAWQLTEPRKDRLGETVPFLIDWGDSAHPRDELDVEITLESLSFTHPDPVRVRQVHAALGLPELPVRYGPPGVHATLRCPVGQIELGPSGFPSPAYRPRKASQE